LQVAPLVSIDGIRFVIRLSGRHGRASRALAQRGVATRFIGASMTTFQRRILFVDDDGDLCELARLALSSETRRVEVACTASQARKAFDSTRFDTLVVDLSLEDADGLDLALELKARRNELSCLVLSGDRGAAARVRDAGIRGFLVKPVPLSQLITAIDRGAA
jgi:DNA-binding NtrC family response regulator